MIDIVYQLFLNLNSKFAAINHNLNCKSHNLNSKFAAINHNLNCRLATINHNLNSKSLNLNSKFAAINHNLNSKFAAINHNLNAANLPQLVITGTLNKEEIVKKDSIYIAAIRQQQNKEKMPQK